MDDTMLIQLMEQSQKLSDFIVLSRDRALYRLINSTGKDILQELYGS